MAKVHEPYRDFPTDDECFDQLSQPVVVTDPLCLADGNLAHFLWGKDDGLIVSFSPRHQGDQILDYHLDSLGFSFTFQQAADLLRILGSVKNFQKLLVAYWIRKSIPD